MKIVKLSSTPLCRFHIQRARRRARVLWLWMIPLLGLWVWLAWRLMPL